jgi:hypothetical protein
MRVPTNTDEYRTAKRCVGRRRLSILITSALLCATDEPVTTASIPPSPIGGISAPREAKILVALNRPRVAALRGIDTTFDQPVIGD